MAHHLPGVAGENNEVPALAFRLIFEPVRTEPYRYINMLGSHIKLILLAVP